MNRWKVVMLLFCFNITLIILVACGQHRELTVETAANAAAATPAPETPSTAPAPPSTPSAPPATTTVPQPAPRLDEVQAAIKRAFQDAVTIDVNRNKEFLVSDFNGDGSPDIAIVVRPTKGRLEDINSELANWTLEDAKKSASPGPTQGVRRMPIKPKLPTVEESDFLLAIIHGYGPTGWRDPAAMQCYLLKNGVGDKMKTQAKKEVLAATKDPDEMPHLGGDIIHATTGGQSGFYYWTTAAYAWYHTTP
jgi:hypothetical protein